ncbi:hypothetical protein NMG60_11019884 [Bertholletia excelsa]
MVLIPFFGAEIFFSLLKRKSSTVLQNVFLLLSPRPIFNWSFLLCSPQPHSSTVAAEMSDPKYAYPYPAQGYYQGPPVMPPPQYPQYAAPPPRREPGFLEGCLAALCCCCLLDECCCDPSFFCVI